MSDIECIRSQNDEFKALECIYLEQFHILRDTNPQKFAIECEPYSGKQGQYKIKIMFEFTQNYPHSALKYQIQPITGITRDNTLAIITTIQDIIHNNRDRPIVYDIVEETRVWIQQYLVEGKAYMKDEQEYMKKKQEVFQKPKFATYTPVTAESFMAWKRQFDAKNKLKKIQKKEGEVKPTGKQYFLGRKQEEIQEESDEQQQDQDYQGQEDQEEQEKIEIPKDDLQMNELFNTS